LGGDHGGGVMFVWRGHARGRMGGFVTGREDVG
jgi:hypothetical protein